MATQSSSAVTDFVVQDSFENTMKNKKMQKQKNQH